MGNVLKIYSYKDPILRTKCRKIERMETWVLTLASDMWETMLRAHAVGLAANQVGYDYCLITINSPDFQGPMVNPIIEEISTEIFHFMEGCLSMPGYSADTGKRRRAVKVGYYDLSGKKESIWLKDISSVIVQHEIDHLLGVVMTDYIDKSLVK